MLSRSLINLSQAGADKRCILATRVDLADVAAITTHVELA